MVTSKTEIAVKAIASTSALVTHTTVGACGRLSVCAPSWEGVLTRNRARKISLVQGFVASINHEVRLTTVGTLGSFNDLQQFLFASVVTISEKDVDNRCCCVRGDVDVDLNFRDGEVGERLEGILNGVSILIARHTDWINLDWAGIVLATELIDKAELEETRGCATLEITRNLLVIVATISITVGFGIVAFGALAKRAVVTFVASIAMALLVFEPWPVNTPRGDSDSLGVLGNLTSEWCHWSLTEVEERVSLGTALSMSTAVVGASRAAATFTSEGWEALAFTGRAITQTTSATLAVDVLVVKRCVLCALQLFAICGLNTIIREHCNRHLSSGRSVNPVLLDVGRRKTHRVWALELRAVRTSESRFATKQSRGGVLFVRASRSLSHKVAQVCLCESGMGGRKQSEKNSTLHCVK